VELEEERREEERCAERSARAIQLGNDDYFDGAPRLRYRGVRY
jgi:hypothetical protein